MKEKNPTIASVLKKYDNSSTRAGYKNALETFLRCMNNLPKKTADGKRIMYDYESLLVEYLKGKRDTSEDFASFAACLKNESTSALSARQVMTFARKFLTRFGVNVDQNDVQDLKRSLKGSAATVKKSMTAKVIEKALAEMDTRGRALTLTLCSSGMRLNEVLSLTLEDIDFDNNPSVVYLRSDITKTSQGRFTFLSNEAVLCLKAWMAKRDGYLKSAANRNKGLIKVGKAHEKSADSDKIFPFSDSVANLVWETALKASGQYTADARTGRNQLKIHQFRGFFITQMSMAGQKTLAEKLAGHDGYLDKSYNELEVEQAGNIYKSVMHAVTIGIPQEFKEKHNELSSTLQLQGESIEGLRAMNEKLLHQMQSMQTRIGQLESVLYGRIEILDGAMKLTKPDE